jgi:opacity protein-like surface antigen
VLLLAAFGVTTTPAHAGGLDLRFGGYFPSANSNLFADVTSLYTRGASFSTATPPGVQKSDWQGFFGGIEYNQKVANNVELAVHVDGYSKSLDTSYRDYVNFDDSPIQQTLRLMVAPVGVSVRLGPTSRRARLAPFVVAGVDAMVYSYEEFGDFIDFFDPDREILYDSFRSDGVDFGVHLGAGLRVAIGDDFAIVGEARYYWSKTQMGDDFDQNEIDLGGLAATIGVHVRF